MHTIIKNKCIQVKYRKLKTNDSSASKSNERVQFFNENLTAYFIIIH